MTPQQRSGILLVDKPAGITSAEALNRLKKAHRFTRIGHGGTLDPFATGLLVVLLGEATKVARFLLEGEKSYDATAALGLETDTGDLTGRVVRQEAAPMLSLEEWQKLANRFLGRSQQRPPAYSAVKVKGKALYEYARRGETVEVKARDIQIQELAITGLSENRLGFRVACSGGTYVRVLANDLAAAAGSCAHLLALRRLGSSSFRVENSLSLETALNQPAEALPLVPLKAGLDHLPQVPCDPRQAEKVRQGNLAVFDGMRSLLEKPGYFLLLEGGKPVAVCNHHPMLLPFCSIERVFDPRLVET
jgi:tRNA pseudouridine55 synthase